MISLHARLGLSSYRKETTFRVKRKIQGDQKGRKRRKTLSGGGKGETNPVAPKKG